MKEKFLPWLLIMQMLQKHTINLLSNIKLNPLFIAFNFSSNFINQNSYLILHLAFNKFNLKNFHFIAKIFYFVTIFRLIKLEMQKNYKNYFVKLNQL